MSRLIWIRKSILFTTLYGAIVFILLHLYTIKYFYTSFDSSVFRTLDNNRIPSIVHFIVGIADEKNVSQHFQSTTPFSFFNYLVILAARRHLRPKQLLIHFNDEPNTFWWNQTKHDTEINATLMKTRLVSKIFGNSVYHHAHRSDILRLEILMKYGGIYLDTDVLTFQSLDLLLNVSDVVMAYETTEDTFICNAVILAKRNAVFLKRIYDAYQSYNPKCWACQSVALFGNLAKIYTKEILVLPYESFFRIGYNENSLFSESNSSDFSSSYVQHFWNKVYGSKLNQLTPNHILNGKFIAAQLIRQAVGNNTLLKFRTPDDNSFPGYITSSSSNTFSLNDRVRKTFLLCNLIQHKSIYLLVPFRFFQLRLF